MALGGRGGGRGRVVDKGALRAAKDLETHYVAKRREKRT
jgi:hypothetical protein